MSRRFPGILAAAALLAVCSCGGGPAPDSYPRATLRALTWGKPAPSVGFRYRLVNASVEAVYRSVGLVREGNIVEFISGRNLEEKIGQAVGGRVDLGVVKEFSPFVHFRVERVFSGNDTTFLTPVPVFLPKVVDATGFSMSPYERIDVDGIQPSRPDALRGLENRKVRFACPITEERGGTGAYFVLHGRNARFRVSAVPDGIGAVLRLLADKGYLFEGGVVVTAGAAAETGADTGFAAAVKVDWVKYGRRVVSE